MQTSGVSLDVIEIEIEAAEEVLVKFRNYGYHSAMTCGVKLLRLQIDTWFVESRSREKRCFNLK